MQIVYKKSLFCDIKNQKKLLKRRIVKILGVSTFSKFFFNSTTCIFNAKCLNIIHLDVFELRILYLDIFSLKDKNR